MGMYFTGQFGKRHTFCPKDFVSVLLKILRFGSKTEAMYVRTAFISLEGCFLHDPKLCLSILYAHQLGS